MSVVSNSGILGQYETAKVKSTATEHKTNMDQNDFLKLLVAQLEHQDPLKPMDDKDMTGQLAQFSSLEQLTNIKTGINTLVSSQNQGSMLSAVGFIGKGVKADGFNLSKSGNTTSTVYYSLGESVANMQVNIYAQDGSLVRTDVIGSKQAGDFQYTWDGMDTSGQKLADGTYGVAMIAEDSAGKPVLVQSKISGEVSGVVTQSGKTMLQLTDGRTVDLASVREVVATKASTTTTTQ
jgi:flagellar basal-body rod modification protein FlgD